MNETSLKRYDFIYVGGCPFEDEILPPGEHFRRCERIICEDGEMTMIPWVLFPKLILLKNIFYIFHAVGYKRFRVF